MGTILKIIREAVMQAFQEQAMAEQQAQMAAAGEANLAASKAYLEANAAREGVQVTESGLQYEVLEMGDPLVLFPEGERKDGPRVHPLFDGAAYVAARAGVQIVPVGIGGSARVMPRHAKMIHPKKVHVVIGEPISIEVGESGRAPRRAIAEASDRLSAELQRLFDLAEARVG